MNTDNINPQHYQQGKIEVIDFILDQKMSYLTASACKYLCRWEHNHLGEGRLDDLRKARWIQEKKKGERRKGGGEEGRKNEKNKKKQDGSLKNR